MGTRARGHVNNKVTDERFMRLIPSPTNKVTEGVLDDAQNRFVAHVVNQLETGTDFPALRPQAAELKQLQGNAVEALNQREAAFLPENQAMVTRRTALMRAQRTYNAMFPQLQVTVGDSALAESFFRPLRSVAAAVVSPASVDEDLPAG